MKVLSSYQLKRVSERGEVEVGHWVMNFAVMNKQSYLNESDIVVNIKEFSMGWYFIKQLTCVIIWYNTDVMLLLLFFF